MSTCNDLKCIPKLRGKRTKGNQYNSTVKGPVSRVRNHGLEVVRIGRGGCTMGFKSPQELPNNCYLSTRCFNHVLFCSPCLSTKKNRWRKIMEKLDFTVATTVLQLCACMCWKAGASGKRFFVLERSELAYVNKHQVEVT